MATIESFVEHLRFLEKTSVRLRIDLLRMLHNAQSGHLGGSLSVVEMLVALYYGQLPRGQVMRYDPEKPGSEEQDYFVLSKGHASPALYTVLADLEFFNKEELADFRQVNSMLQAYPSKKIPGITLCSGSPAFGFAGAVGLAMALKAERQPWNVFCLVGDGELQDGQFWEAVLLAHHYKLDNLIVLVDYNGLQMDGSLRTTVTVEPIADKFEGFGWKSIHVIDGHNFEDLLIGIERGLEIQRRPTVLICRTVKGKGVAFAEGKASYHAEVLSDQEMSAALPALEAQLKSYNHPS
ncbi:transketolase [Candidatus Peregrinibacteria bacterium]|nr:transketolase [Candidatus Peregrinibacteria bacterium]